MNRLVWADSIELAIKRAAGSRGHRNEPVSFINCGEILDHFNNYCVLKRNHFNGKRQIKKLHSSKLFIQRCSTRL